MWTDIEQTLARIDSMDAGAAAGDAAEIRRIVAAAKAVGERLATVFASPSVLSGTAADASTVSGVALGTHVQTSVTGLETGAGALDAAAGALTASIAQRERIASLTGATRTPEIRIAAQSAVHAMMAGSYNIPMSSSTAGIADQGTPNPRSTRVGGPDTTSDPTSAAGTTSTASGTSTFQTSGESPLNDSGTTAFGAPGPEQAGRQPAASPSTAPASRVEPVPNSGQAPSRTATGGTGPGPTASGPTGSGPTGSGPGGPAPSGAVAGTSARTVSATPRGEVGLSLTTPRTPGTIVAGVPIPALGATPSPSVAPGTAQSQVVGTPRPSISGASAAAQSSAATAASAASRASAGASPAMGPGAVRRKDDEERTGVDYLRSAREGELILGTAPLVSPAVLPPPVEQEDVALVMADGAADGSVRGEVDQKLDPTL
ncbi:hypothetical protein [Gordonia sp. (in: high G+C Gram-positive bacteria)]|uniref:hypothetical protein n=1 Tax=Gordonia sp. (in: high G+C Gram-positive bacteria) TaxID=84139 RepID=UPI003F9514EF